MAGTLSVSLIIKAIDRASSSVRRVTNNFQAMRDAKVSADRSFAKAANIRHAAEGMKRFSDAALSAATAPIKEFENFEAAMSRVKAKTKDLDAEGFQKLNSTAKMLGATTMFTAEQSANALEFLAQAGFSVTDSLKTVPTVLNLATAAGTDLGRTSDILTDVMGAFGKSSGDAASVSDILAKTMTGSNTTLETLFETMKLAGPQATDLGVRMEDVAVMAGIMGNAGIKGSLGGTALRGALTKLIKPSGKAQEILEKLKITTADASGNFVGLVPILEQVNKKTKGIGTATRGVIFSELFGVRGLAGASNIIRSFDTGKFDELAKSVNNATGATKKMADIMQDNAKGATTLLTSAMSGLLTSLGEKLSPTLTTIKKLLTSVLQGMNEWVNNNPRLSKGIALVGGAVAVTATAVTSLMFTMSAATTAMGLMRLAQGANTTATVLAGAATKATARTMIGSGVKAFAAYAAGAWSSAAGVIAATWPILLIAGAIGLMVGAVVLAVKHWDKLTSVWERVKNASLGVKVVLGVLALAMAPVLIPILALAFAAKKIIENWGPIKSFFKGIWDSITEGIKGAIGWLKQIKLPPGLQTILDINKKAFSFVSEGIMNPAKSIGSAAGSVASELAFVATGEDKFRSKEAGDFLGRTNEASLQNQGAGVLEIKFDAKGMPFVEKLESTLGVDLDIDTGFPGAV